MVEDKIKLALQTILQGEFGISSSDFVIEHPADLAHGDWATNVALQYAKEAGISPAKLAQDIVAKLVALDLEDVERIETAGPGFINFFLKNQYFSKELVKILNEKDAYGRNTAMTNKKVVVEYTDPNPFKVFHIGHLMPNIIGESIATLLEYSGAEVKRANYQGDVGLHVARALWGMLRTAYNMPDDSSSLADKTRYLGEAYTMGAKAYEDDQDAKAEIDELNKKIYERSDDEINRLYDLGRQWSLEHFEKLYSVLGTKFDYYFFESQAAEPGKRIVQEYKDKGIFLDSEGAVVFPGEQYGLHTRVFLNQAGLPTYEAKELALAKMKHDVCPYDMSVVVTANEITEYFRVLLKVMELVFPDLASKTKHIGHGMLKFSDGKMSSRKGNVITGESLIEDSIESARDKISSAEGVSTEEADTISRAVGIGALKYAILKQSIGQDIVYEKERSFSLEGDSGPYVQYAYVRVMSVLNKAEDLGIKPEVADLIFIKDMPNLARLAIRFGEVIVRAQEKLSPHIVATYLTELAGEFNSYYSKYKILDANNITTSSNRVALVAATGAVLKNGLEVLGITAPIRM